LTITLAKPYELNQIGVLLDTHVRQDRFAVETSADNATWTPVVERGEPRGTGWQQFSFPPRTVQHIRVRTLADKPSPGLSIAELDARCPGLHSAHVASRPVVGQPPRR
jgi:hypothetical protein